MIDHIRFPGFETYVPPKIYEEHVEELLTKDKIKFLEKTKMEFLGKEKETKEEQALKRFELKFYKVISGALNY